MKCTNTLWLALVGVGVGANGCFEAANPAVDTDAFTDTAATSADTTAGVADGTTAGGGPVDGTTTGDGVVPDGTTSGETTGMPDDTTGPIPATTGETTGGCMPGVFGRSVFGEACFQ